MLMPCFLRVFWQIAQKEIKILYVELSFSWCFYHIKHFDPEKLYAAMLVSSITGVLILLPLRKKSESERKLALHHNVLQISSVSYSIISTEEPAGAETVSGGEFIVGNSAVLRL